MFARLLVVLAVLASAVAFMPAGMMRTRRVEMSLNANQIQAKIGKALGIAAMGIALVGPMEPANADGAVSVSTVFRARTKYGAKIMDIAPLVDKADFAALGDKKILNAFDLFISGSNAQKSVTAKESAKKEKAIEAAFFTAVKAKDSGKMKSAYADFINVADLKVS